MENDKRKIIAIVGPTASGKTAVAVKLAKKFNGEIVSADSRQVYKGLDIGTGKDLKEYGDVKYHLIDIKDPEEKFTLFDYLPLAKAAIEDIFSRGKLPIIVGGTGLYVQALTEGFQLEQNLESRILNQAVILTEAKKSHSKISRQARDDKCEREELEKHSVDKLKDILKKLDMEVYEKLSDPQNPHRLIRAIERAQGGEIISKKKPNFRVLQIGLEWPREELNKRIDKRVDDRFEEGMLNEAESLLRSGVNPEWLFNLGLEYKIMTSFLISNHKYQITNKIQNIKIQELIRNSKLEIKSFDEMVQILKLRSHQYAKRQMTWFRRFSEIKWLSDYRDIESEAKAFLKN